MIKRWARAALRSVVSVAVLCGVGACAPQALLVRGAADQLASQGSSAEEDLVLAREASAFFLKLSESVLERTPGHLALAESVAAGFTQYAYAFVQADAERLEASDAKAAQRLRQRAARLYARALGHAMRALESHQPALRQALAARALSAAPSASTATLRLTDAQVGVAYWAAAAWGAQIALSKDDPDTVADLPLAVQLAQLAWQTKPEHGEGALASLMGSLEAARPGGSAQQALDYFESAILAAGGRNAGPLVAKAEAIALPAGDRAGFEALLRQALAVSAKRRDLANEVMRERAQWLLDTVEDRF